MVLARSYFKTMGTVKLDDMLMFDHSKEILNPCTYSKNECDLAHNGTKMPKIPEVSMFQAQIRYDLENEYNVIELPIKKILMSGKNFNIYLKKYSPTDSESTYYISSEYLLEIIGCYEIIDSIIVTAKNAIDPHDYDKKLWIA